MNPYDILGVARNAPREAVRRAYRAKAKKAHPDTGGSVQTFAMVKLCADCLTDDARRAHYDATGEVKGAEPDGVLSAAMQLAFAAVDAVLAEAARRGVVFEFDVIADAIRTLNDKLKEIDMAVKQAIAKAEEAEKLATRFKARRGKPNRLSPMLESKARECRGAAATALDSRPPVEMAITILGEHTFAYDPPQAYEPSSAPSWAYVR